MFNDLPPFPSSLSSLLTQPPAIGARLVRVPRLRYIQRVPHTTTLFFLPLFLSHPFLSRCSRAHPSVPPFFSYVISRACVRSLHHIAGSEAEGGIDFQTGSAVGGSLPKYQAPAVQSTGSIPGPFSPTTVFPLLFFAFSPFSSLPSVYSFDSLCLA